MSGKTMVRYSDEELAEFKELIEGKIAEAKENLAAYLEAYSNAGNDTMDTAPTFKNLEEGNMVLSKEENGQLAARLEKYIKNLEAALIRIENKTYGVCRVTGKLIPKERLRIVPHATLSYEAKMNQNK
ncbi:MAG: TraR/DksA family transcriptional regulator [Bacteroidales bacterium]|nr:TraR/DksA family transcriptional regulator [Bacteroidales bacterium]